jgi:dihydroxyacetone kinase-like predicted kinase
MQNYPLALIWGESAFIAENDNQKKSVPHIGSKHAMKVIENALRRGRLSLNLII